MGYNPRADLGKPFDTPAFIIIAMFSNHVNLCVYMHCVLYISNIQIFRLINFNVQWFNLISKYSPTTQDHHSSNFYTFFFPIRYTSFLHICDDHAVIKIYFFLIFPDDTISPTGRHEIGGEQYTMNWTKYQRLMLWLITQNQTTHLK